MLKEWVFSIIPALELSPLKAILLLSEIFHKVNPNFFNSSHDFGYFYPWGEILFNDFKTIKRFQILNDIQDSAKGLGFPIESVKNIIENLKVTEEVRKVYKTIFRLDPPEAIPMEKMMQFWENFDELFAQFHSQLDENGFSYYEYQLEKLIDQIHHDTHEFLSSIEAIHFCFFHSFYPLEKKWIETLAERVEVHVWSLKPGLIFQDVISGKDFSQIPSQKFIYQIHPEQLFKNSPFVHYHPIERDLKEENPKKLVFHQIPYPSQEGKALNSLLVQKKKENEIELPLFVVMFNSHYLFSLLNSINYEQLGIKGGDIYVGIPLSETPFYHFLVICLDLWANQKENRFRSHDIKRLFKHPYIEKIWRELLSQGLKNQQSHLSQSRINTEPIFRWERLLQINPYLSKEELLIALFGDELHKLQLHPLLEQIFSFPTTVKELSNRDEDKCAELIQKLKEQVLGILNTLQNVWQEKPMSKTQLEEHLLHVFQIDLMDFFHEIEIFLLHSRVPIKDGLKLVQQLFSSLFKSHFLYLSVEKERRDLVVGDLEFILAHFPRQVFLLNFNQNSFPKLPSSTTLLPYELFTTLSPSSLFPDEYSLFHQVIQFENLLSWATEAHFFYHSQDSPSPLYYVLRMIDFQIPIYQWQTKTPPFVKRIPQPFLIKKEKIYQFFQKVKESGLSFSTIKTYLECPLKFYYTYIENLPILEEQEEILSKMELGSILHLVLQEIKREEKRAPFSKVIRPEMIKGIVFKCVKDYFAIHKSHWLIDLQLATITQNVINALLQEEKIRKRLQQTWNIPLIPESLQESRFHTLFSTKINGHEISIPIIGNIDLIHLHENRIYSIVDYKNSRFYSKTNQNISKQDQAKCHPILEQTILQLPPPFYHLRIQENYKLYPYIQVLFYAYLLKKANLSEMNLKLHNPFLASLIFTQSESADSNGFCLSILITDEVTPESFPHFNEENIYIVTHLELENSINTLITQFLNALLNSNENLQEPNRNHCRYCVFQTLCEGTLFS